MVGSREFESSGLHCITFTTCRTMTFVWCLRFMIILMFWQNNYCNLSALFIRQHAAKSDQWKHTVQYTLPSCNISLLHCIQYICNTYYCTYISIQHVLVIHKYPIRTSIYVYIRTYTRELTHSAVFTLGFAKVIQCSLNWYFDEKGFYPVTDPAYHKISRVITHIHNNYTHWEKL